MIGCFFSKNDEISFIHSVARSFIHNGGVPDIRWCTYNVQQVEVQLVGRQSKCVRGRDPTYQYRLEGGCQCGAKSDVRSRIIATGHRRRAEGSPTS